MTTLEDLNERCDDKITGIDEESLTGRMGVSEASSTLDRWLTPVWLRKLCGVLSYFCVSLRTGAYGPGVNIGRPPRFAFSTYMLWVVTLGWQAIRCSREASTEIQTKG
jgi:hypothetical protein